MDLYADEGHLDAPRENAFKSLFWEGSTQGDAFLTTAAAQVSLCTTAIVSAANFGSMMHLAINAAVILCMQHS